MTNDKKRLRGLRDKVLAVEASIRQIDCMMKEVLEETDKALVEIQRLLRVRK